jgi:uncharacterized protein involved in cysteine biosynthesis
VILTDFLLALRQTGDPRFRRVLLLGMLLTFALLGAVYAGFLGLIQLLTPDVVEIPLVGPVGGLDTLLSWGSLLFMVGLSVFLMVPVASAFTGLFLEDVAEAVEARHYPHLPPAPRIPFWDATIDSVNFFGVLVAVNLVAVVAYVVIGPLAPVAFWVLNGFLLGREYFMMAAMRRLGREGARALRRRHPLQVWSAGILMAAPLSIPIINLAIPVLGAATFTHLVHRLSGAASSPASRNRAP